ncbi:MAG: O-antigen ligase family protein [Lachnospiraceae bacterium]|nr:O-antigen ligase family protein [Lachnospiraceae bacterium]
MTTLYILLLLDTGGVYARSSWLLQLAALAYLLWRVFQRGMLRLPKRWVALETVLIAVGVILSAVTGVDTGESLYGVIRMLTACAMLFALCQCTAEEKEALLGQIPYIGLGMAALSALAGSVGFLRNWVSVTGRLAGAFEYPNTMALFLLLGIVILERSEKRGGLLCQALLCGCILLTGSRTVFVVLCAYLAYRLYRRKKAGLVLLLAALVLVILLLHFFNIETVADRFLTLSLSSSTLQGRLLYWEDALRMLWKYPLGLGYMGYFYMQQLMQTGVYSVRFVHNDWLQLALDYGLLTAAGVLLWLCRRLRGAKLAEWKKELLVLTGLCSLFDFHLQYWGIVLIVLLPLSETFPVEERPVTKVWKYGISGAALVTTALSGILLAAGWYAGQEDYDSALMWDPISTEYLAGRMLQAADLEEGAYYAEKILERNALYYAAYEIRSNARASGGDVKGFVADRKTVLSLRKYEIEEYEEYIQILYSLYVNAEAENADDADACLAALAEVPELISEVKKATSLRAFQIQDIPQLELGNEYESLIEILTGGEETCNR